MEVWKDIKGYEGLYQISNLGNVKSLEKIICSGKLTQRKKEILLKPNRDKYGYLRVVLYKDKKPKTFQIHRLVAINFIDNNNNLSCVNHIDENKENNCVENLEWCTPKYNTNYGTSLIRRARSQSKKVAMIDKENNKIIYIFNSLHEVKDVTGFSMGNISQCCNHKSKYAYGYKWEYIKEES